MNWFRVAQIAYTSLLDGLRDRALGMVRLLVVTLLTLLTPAVTGAEEICDDYQRKDIPLARQIKADLKAEARRNGLPERLMYLFDQLGDCPMCIEGDREHPIWPVIVIDYVDNDHPKKPGSLKNLKNIMVPWTGDMEYLARQGMREGYVKSYHILLETAPCECCDAKTQEEYDAWNDNQPRPQDSPTWHPELDLDTSVAYSEDDPDNLGEDPPDLVDIPEDTREWDMVEWPPLILPPPERPMTTLCTACRDAVQTHNDMTVRINQHARVIARLVRSREGTRSLMQQRSAKLRALEQKGSTPEVLAERERLWTEFEELLGQFNRESLRIKALFEERRALLAELEPLKAAVRACEARCVAKDAQPAPAILPSPVTTPDALPGKTRLATQACPGCEAALEKRNALARQMNQLVDSMAGTAVDKATLAAWETLRQQLVGANETLRLCLEVCDDPGALSYFNDGNTIEGLTGYSGAFNVMEIVTDWCPDLKTSDLPPQYWIDHLKDKARRQGVPEEMLVIYDALPRCTPCLKQFLNGNTLPYFVYPRDGYPNEYEWTPWRFGRIAAPELVRMRRLPGFYLTLDIEPCTCCPGLRDAAASGGEDYPPGAGLTPGVTLDFSSPDAVKSAFYDAYNELKDFSPEPDPQAEPAPEPFQPPMPDRVGIDSAKICDACKPLVETIDAVASISEGLRQQITDNQAFTRQLRNQLGELKRDYWSLARAQANPPGPITDHLKIVKIGQTTWYAKRPLSWPVQAAGFSSGLLILRDQIAQTEAAIAEKEQELARLIDQRNENDAKLEKLYDDLAYCVATRCNNLTLASGDTLFGYVTTACDACRDLVKQHNDWLRDRRTSQPTRPERVADLKKKNPGFSDEEIQRAADRLEKEAQRDEKAYIDQSLREIQACEEKHCSNGPDATCQDGDVTVDENGLQFTDKPCRGVLRSSQQRSATFTLPTDPALQRKDRIAPGVDDAWGLRAINLFSAKAGRGANKPRPVTVAVIDSGLDLEHPDITNALWRNAGESPGNGADDDNNRYVDDIHGWNFVTDTADVTDNNGHGTLVAGIIGATADNDIGIAGVNSWARIMPLKVTDRTGEGDSLHVAAAIAYAVNNGARVINVSLGGDAYSPAEKAAVAFARRKGVLVVVAAGNHGASADAFWPAALPGVITVAATEPGGARTAYSNWGSAVDIAAPGSKILSLRAAETDPMALVDDKYTALANVVGEDGLLYHATGTSFAAPYVAGVASLLLSLDDALTAQQVERMLLYTATDIETPGVDALTGYGALNARAALDARPDFFIDATISGVALAPGGDAVQVLGTADADRFTRAVIELGEGDNPTAWQSVGKLKRSVRAGVLASIPTSTLAGAARWTLRVTTTHRDGQERVGLLPLALQ